MIKLGRQKVKTFNIDDRLLGLQETVEAGRGRLDDGAVERAEAILERAVTRRSLSADHTVVGFFGATGSGKSSLLNAVVGRPVAQAAVRRPTTTAPLAVLGSQHGAEPLLDWLGIESRYVLEQAEGSPWSAGVAGLWTDIPQGLVLLDLPDVDSVVQEHRQIAQRLVGMVDVVVWVVDPQKYADAVLHDDFIAPLSRHAAVTLVVLNQADRLAGDHIRNVMSSLTELLQRDGLAATGRSAPVATSAATGMGIGAVRARITEVVNGKEAAAARLSADLEGAVEQLQESHGTGQPAGVTPFAREALTEGLVRAANADGIAQAARRSYVLNAGKRTGWLPVRWVGGFRKDPLRRLHLQGLHDDHKDPSLHRSSLPPMSAAQRASADTAVRRFADEVSEGSTAVWERSIREAARSRHQDLPDDLDQALAHTDLRRGAKSWWWIPLDVIQWLALLTAVAGLLWLTGLFALQYLQIPVPQTPEVEGTGVPVPTLLVVTGLVVGLVLGVLSAIFARWGGRWRARGVSKRLRQQIAVAAHHNVIQPVEEELTVHDRVGHGLARAAAMKMK
ncbi:GTPase [Kocuria sp.]|uniref:GTPase n=1 Tax=Kocuria sp. TaxID=1871328 RepID=UPI0026DF447C|nr:GTPase [Kocuria sp.]MDO5618333.1 50S ribosome-binding GTPase [Kocuria sp.]